MILTQASKSFATNEKQIKLRRKSVISIEKITRAMKMVAAAKMRGELRRLDDGKKFGYKSVDMLFKSD
jgi:F-type H+-transporting ATPase subunit gamma